MRWLIVKQREELNKYSYATYIYDIIADNFIANEGLIAELAEEDSVEPKQNLQDILFVINGPDTNEALMRLWYSVTLPSIVKKIKADKVIYLNGLLGSYKLIRSPQIMLLYGSDYLLNHRPANKWQQLSLKRIAKNVERATLCFTYSESAIDGISKVLNSALSCKIKYLRPAPQPDFRAIGWEEKQSVKAKYSGKEEYYLMKISGADTDEIILYLKAFSIFKKWQKSGMKLIILVSENVTGNQKFMEIFSSYLFRNDVFFIEEIERDDYRLLLAAAYGFLMLTEKDSDLLYVLEALQCGTPVITYRLPSVNEIAQDAPYYLEGKNTNDVSQAMITLYKSEKLRETHIEKAGEIAAQFDFEGTKNQLMNMLKNV